MGKRKKHSAEFKKRVALDALKESNTMAKIASDHGVHSVQVSEWKRQAIEGLEMVFQGTKSRKAQQVEYETRESQLLEKIGQLTVELDWLKKNLTAEPREKREMIDTMHPHLSIKRQCELLGLNRSTFYLEPAGETRENLELMKRIDEIYTQYPFYGSRRMTVALCNEGMQVNRKRVCRLMGLMGIEAIYLKPRLTVANQEHKKYPYLLRGLPILAPDQVWSADITYVRMGEGCMYLFAIIDWWSRKVLSWTLSNSLDVHFCLEGLEKALSRGRPLIFNTDQGVQFTSCDFTSRLLSSEIEISMDGKGRALDNVFVERLWRSVKYEEIYLKDYRTVGSLGKSLDKYFVYYNNERPHQALSYRTPEEVYSF